MATRDAAAAPGGMDSMAFFEGSYALQPLSSKTPMKPLEVLISTTNGARLLPLLRRPPYPVTFLCSPPQPCRSGLLLVQRGCAQMW